MFGVMKFKVITSSWVLYNTGGTIMEGKNCSRCKEFKLFTEFTKGTDKYGLRYECRICKNLLGKEYKQRPESQEKRRKQERDRYARRSPEERTARYLKKKR